MKEQKTSPHAAYVIYPGVTAAEAAEKGLVVVEQSADGLMPIYGRYTNTETGAALETLKDADTRAPAPVGGEKLGGIPTNDKGSLVNTNDPVIHGVAENNPHEDGASPNDAENTDLDVEGYVPDDQPKRGRPRKA